MLLTPLKHDFCDTWNYFIVVLKLCQYYSYLRPLVFLWTFTFNSLNARKTFSIVAAVSCLVVNIVYSKSQKKIVAILSYAYQTIQYCK